MEHVTKEGIVRRELGMIEVLPGIARHSEALHHRARAEVGWHRERDNLRESVLVEADSTRLARGLAREAAPPSRAREAPGDLDRGREMRVEADAMQPHESDEGLTAFDFHGPGPEAVLGEVGVDAVCEAVARGAVEHSAQMHHHLRIGVQAREGFTISVPKRAEHESARSVCPHRSRSNAASATRASLEARAVATWGRIGWMPSEPKSFATLAELDAWLKKNHAKESELWVRMFKKGSGTPSVDWGDCVIAGLTWGWIDGQRKTFDEVSFIQRITPRRAKSTWSKKNREHAERLIAEGRMQPAGLAHVEAARADGRWDAAYAGSAEMEIPEDFLKELKKNHAAAAFFATLNRQNLFAIYHRLHNAKRPETRAKRVMAIIAQLAEGKAFH